MYSESPAFIVVDLFDVDGVVKVARIVRIDRDDELAPQIFAAINHSLLD